MDKEIPMTNRERIKKLIAGEPADRCGFWLGAPHANTWPILTDHFGCPDPESVRVKLGDEMRHLRITGFTQRPFFIDKQSHGQNGPLAGCETVEEVEQGFDWPDPTGYDPEVTLEQLRNAGDVYRMGGMWAMFYHNMMDLFGMENYLMMMHTDPDVIHAATDRVCQFYYDVHEHFYPLAKGELDAFFFGNDFGTQNSLICSPAMFDEFLLPWMKQFIDQAHRHGLQVVLHSCGSIYEVIEPLIDAGVDCLHPLQARARNMDAETLARDFKGRVTFMGGVDTQDLLVHATPDEVKAEVRRLKTLLGPRYIVSPSHETVLPDIPPANLQAMADTAREN